MPSKSEMQDIARVKTEAGTGFIKLEEGTTLYFVDGFEVTKEVFIQTSDTHHLLSNSSSVKCSKCGPWLSVFDDYGKRCDRPQPSGALCDGVFTNLPSPKTWCRRYLSRHLRTRRNAGFFICAADGYGPAQRAARRHCEGHSLVPIDERMVLNQAFQKRGSLVNDRVVVAALRSVKGRFKGAGIADPCCATVTLDQLVVKEEGVRGADVLRHLKLLLLLLQSRGALALKLPN